MKNLFVLFFISVVTIILVISCVSNTSPNSSVNQAAEATAAAVNKPQEAEPEPVSETCALHKDLNGDGVIDSVFVEYDGGSLSGGNYLRIVNGKTKREYLANNYDYIGAMIGVCVLAPTNKAFAQVARVELLPEQELKALDPVAHWVVNSLKSRRIITQKGQFTSVSQPCLHWLDKLDIPKTYCINAKQEFARDIIKHRAGRDDEYDGRDEFIIADNSSVWLVVNADYRFAKELGVVHSSDGLKVHANNHCVAIEKGGKFAWVFVNDCFWTGRGTRNGIESLEVNEGVVLVSCGTFERFMIDPITGQIATYYLNTGEDEEVKDLIRKFRKLNIRRRSN